MLYLKEIWKKIDGYPDKIEVSNLGNVKSNDKLLKFDICSGYCRVHFSHKGINYKELVHRLIAKAFIPNPDNKLQVNHIDGNKKNNNVNNLEWCTAGENIKHAYKTNLRSAKGENNTQAKLSEEQIKEIRSLYVKGKHCEFNSRGLAKKYNVNPKTILDIVNKKNWKDII